MGKRGKLSERGKAELVALALAGEPRWVVRSEKQASARLFLPGPRALYLETSTGWSNALMREVYWYDVRIMVVGPDRLRVKSGMCKKPERARQLAVEKAIIYAEKQGWLD